MNTSILQNFWVDTIVNDANLSHLLTENPDGLQFDVAEALYCYTMDYNEENNPMINYFNNLLRKENFKARPSLTSETLEEDGKIFYNELTTNLDFYENKFAAWIFDNEKKGIDVLSENTINENNNSLPTSLEQIRQDAKTTPNGNFSTYYFTTDSEMDNYEALKYFFDTTGIEYTLLDGSYAENIVLDNNNEFKYYFHMSGQGDMFNHILEVEIQNILDGKEDFEEYNENTIYTSFDKFVSLLK